MTPDTLTASELTALIRARQLSAVEATRATLARIDRLNPGLNAIVQRRDEDALAEARALDARIGKTGTGSPEQSDERTHHPGNRPPAEHH